MSARAPLHWGRGDALTEASGQITIQDYAEGDEAWVLVDHSAQAVFADCPMPALSGDLQSFAIDVALLAPDGTATDGGQFVLHIRCVQAPVSGYGGATPVTITWRRRGVAQ
ncbi:MAG: hypothetical protein H5T86_12010 [Armatimonadetes bacterium]|nr:hypothetical protein [Armatimonadota bacterium]